VRAAGARESCESAITGQPSSFASPLSERLMLEISCWRFSVRPAPDMSCR
jgi:hypothetical protein